jgi:uncharacterized protein YbjT (DUF2867 family)
MKVLLTGGSGNLGHTLVPKLLADDLNRHPCFPSLGARLAEQVQVHRRRRVQLAS